VSGSALPVLTVVVSLVVSPGGVGWRPVSGSQTTALPDRLSRFPDLACVLRGASYWADLRE
jgi:hypothetical protein